MASVAGSFLKLFCLFACLTLASGCIRLTGSAGYWSQGPGDEPPKGKTVGFDTNDFVPGAPAPGSIEV